MDYSTQSEVWIEVSEEPVVWNAPWGRARSVRSAIPKADLRDLESLLVRVVLTFVFRTSYRLARILCASCRTREQQTSIP